MESIAEETHISAAWPVERSCEAARMEATRLSVNTGERSAAA